MELGSLHELLHNGDVLLDGDLVLTILQDIAKGVRFLHEAKPPIIHADLKSKNCLVDRFFRVKVAGESLCTLNQESNKLASSVAKILEFRPGFNKG